MRLETQHNQTINSKSEFLLKFNKQSKNDSEFLKIKERMRGIIRDLMFKKFEIKYPLLFRIGQFWRGIFNVKKRMRNPVSEFYFSFI